MFMVNQFSIQFLKPVVLIMVNQFSIQFLKPVVLNWSVAGLFGKL